MKLLYWNIHTGKGLDGNVDLQRIAQVIMDSEADLVMLSEVDNGRLRTGRIDQTEELVRLTGFTDAIFYPSVDFGDDGLYGNALLSRLPLLETSGMHLPNPDDGERRSALRAVVAVGPERQIAFYGTHLSIVAAERPEQVDAILQRVAAESLPVILAGDLNAESDEVAVAKLKQHGFVDTQELTGLAPALTFPAGSAEQRIDYIFTEESLKECVVDCSVIKTDASDHYPVLIELAII